MNNLYSSLVINISLLVLIATFLTKISFVKQVLSKGRNSKLADQLMLAVIFGLFCVFSTCTGVKVNGAIQNTRVLGALAAGLLGGPVVGIGAATIGALHRFLYDPSGFTSLACAVSTLFEGVLGSVVWALFHRRNRKQSPLSLFCITALAECFQMGFILLIARPFYAAIALVKVIAIPMIAFNSLGMILFFDIFDEVFTKQDLLAAEKIRLALTIADECIPYIQKLQKTKQDYNAMAEKIKNYSNCSGVLFLDTAGKRAFNDSNLVISENLKEEVLNLKEGTGFLRVADRKDANYRYLKRHIAFVSPLTQAGTVWAYLVIFLPRQVLSIQAELDFVTGLAKFFSTNFELAQVEKQKKLRQRAEFQALQSQINPHFLFNSLNTISCFCREKPERARELLLDLSVYFRNTLAASTDYMVPFRKEMEQVRAYLELEEARFEDRLEVFIHVSTEAEEVSIPPLILQPIVENAIKHGAMKRNHGMVSITGVRKDACVRVTVKDNGPGFNHQDLCGFLQQKKNGKCGLLNVDARLKSIYGMEHGLLIDTNELGTSITMEFKVKENREEKKDEYCDC